MASFTLFPVPPTTPVSPLSPPILPGHNPGSTKALLANLEDNHKRWHIFFNDQGFHNHISHHLLAIWALGAPASILDAAYEHEIKSQRPAFKSPEPITSSNFNKHLGNENFYQAYLEYFTNEVKTKGTVVTLENTIFGSGANFVGDAKPQMLNRFMAALLHPLIHTGYGVEFNIPGLVVEGLAQTAVHPADSKSLIPQSFFAPLPSDGLVSKLQSALSLGGSTTTRPASNGVHAFTVVARILNDPEFVSKKFPLVGVYAFAVRNFSGSISRHANEWITGVPTAEDVQEKVEELLWLNSALYGIGGYDAKDKTFNADFFLMHLVTSSLFLPSLIAKLSLPSQVLLLRAYLVVSLTWWIGRGRPAIDFEGFYNNPDTAHPNPPGDLPAPWTPKWSLPSGTSVEAANPNPWTYIIQRSLSHPDEHLPKIQRALANYARLFGSRPAGFLEGKTELPGAEKLDGTLFVRAAGLTINRLARYKDGDDEAPFWDRTGFFGYEREGDAYVPRE